MGSKSQILRWFTHQRKKVRPEMSQKSDPLHLLLIKECMEQGDHYPTKEKMESFAAQSGKSFAQIRTAFDNQRKQLKQQGKLKQTTKNYMNAKAGRLGRT